MFFFSRFDVWHSRERANSCHGGQIPIDGVGIVTHAALKTGVGEIDVRYPLGDELFSNERWSELIGKTPKSNTGSDGRKIGESGFRRLPYAGGAGGK